ncbi:uncharacterized protein [Physcomitrium patens]|uniref:Tubulin--tyrosine ligase-like protein 9 n=1 Tax=Physcomitrium patens TaxID=3218 RepID=A0A2K1L8D4_PHYPA|nr:probable tubulin polyglutamylase TTLL9 isoform X3 [Physcomitrium patens]PNR62308.1 hypothetical protein PHYPA_000732 [Physcomitrium patens]|eukprot:XP_024394465.1 probable tubulin polyglutamylase TTLL9 isoform X3 [Physcomitrella patens]
MAVLCLRWRITGCEYRLAGFRYAVTVISNAAAKRSPPSTTALQQYSPRNPSDISPTWFAFQQFIGGQESLTVEHLWKQDLEKIQDARPSFCRYSATYSPPACADRKLPTPYTRSPQRPPPANKMALRAPNKNLIRFRCFWKTTVIFEVLKNRGWTETNSELDWDFFWSDVGWMYEFFDHIHLADHQRFNHFRNYYELTRKDLLIKNLKRMKKTLERDGQTVEAGKYNFFPQTYALPAEYGLFVEEFKRMSPDPKLTKLPKGAKSLQEVGVWIMKPVGKARGRGIFLFTRLSQISEWKKDHRWKIENPQVENYIVQRYIDNPYLIGGKKFDLRLYVCVLSYAPLKAYVYRSGFARFTIAHFTVKKEDIVNNLVHLTNFSIQKHAPTFKSKTGTKWSLHSLKMHMISKHGEQEVNALFHKIHMLILRSLLAVQNVIIQDKHCFELYGYDILVDDTLKPWILEVNASPSLAADTPVDHELKYGMLDDVLTLVDMEHKLPPQSLTQVGGFDVLIDQTAPPAAKPPQQSHLLGCYNDRLENLKELRKPARQSTA